MCPAVARDTPVVVEVLAPSLVGSGLPRMIDEIRRASRPAPGDVGSDDAYRLMRVLDRLRDEFGGRIVVHLIEPLSFAWIVRVLRHRPRRYPAFIIGGREIIAGCDEPAVAARIERLVRAGPVPP